MIRPRGQATMYYAAENPDTAIPHLRARSRPSNNRGSPPHPRTPLRSRTATLVASLAGGCFPSYALFPPTSQMLGSFPYRARTTENTDRGVLATFFQVGRCVERYPGLSLRMSNARHTIGNHS